MDRAFDAQLHWLSAESPVNESANGILDARQRESLESREFVIVVGVRKDGWCHAEVLYGLRPEAGNPTGDCAGVPMVSRGAEEAAGGTHTCAVLLDARGHARKRLSSPLFYTILRSTRTRHGKRQSAWQHQHLI